VRTFRHCRRITWAALWALVFAALAPTLPALHGDGRGVSVLADLCTSAGHVGVSSTDVGNDGSPGSLGLSHGDCPLCAARGLVLAGPPASLGVAPRLEAHGVAPAEPVCGRLVRIAWSPANPRAPPSAA
jgi:hypothetical protein